MVSLFEFIGSLKKRTVDNKNTTIGGGVLGALFAAVIGQIETASGCHFQEAFAGMDWVQITGYAMLQAFGAMTTDGNKTV